jgi:hypothetical protein
MEWLTDYPERGETLLKIITLLIAITVLWFGRKRLAISIPITLALLLVAGVAIPSAMPARSAAQRNTCINNLQKIAEAKAVWARENGKSQGDLLAEAELFGSTTNVGILRHRVTCPAGGTYDIGIVGEKPNCSLEKRGHKLP